MNAAVLEIANGNNQLIEIFKEKRKHEEKDTWF
jgi:hypothetical protein